VQRGTESGEIASGFRRPAGVLRFRGSDFLRRARGRPGSGPALRPRVLLVVLVCGAALVAAPAAMASGGRGHVFAFAFGRAGKGAGELALEAPSKLGFPAGVAVDESSGDVYVVDAGNLRVQEFSIQGAFIESWGWGVRDGADEFETCTSGCMPGLAGSGKGELKEPSAIAVDNSPGGTGTVYVGANASAKKPDVQRFAAGGEAALGKLPVEEEGQLDGLAVDAQGTVWLYRGEEEESGVIEGFDGVLHPERLGMSLSSPLECPKSGFGVDASGEDFYVAHELLTGEGECPSVLERERREAKEPAEGRLLRPVVAGRLNAAEVTESGGVAARELDRQGTTGVSVDEASGEGTPLGGAASGDVYLDEGTSVAEFDAAGELVQRFGAGVIKAGEGVAVDSKTGEVYVLDAGEERVEVFEPEPEAKPTIHGLGASNLTPNDVHVQAQVDPEGSDTHYFFQYGTADCVSEPGDCTDTPVAPGADLGSAFGDQGVAAELTGLTAGTTYYYRLVASNGLGVAEGSETLETFETLPSSDGLLADGRAWELVSPAEKDGSGIEPLAREGSLIQAAPSGEAVTYIANGPVVAEPDGNRAPEPTQVISTRSSGGWASQDVMSPHSQGEGLEPGEPSEYRFFSEDLALSLVQPPGGKVQPLEEPPLAPGASEKTLYLRADPPLTPTAGEQARYSQAVANEGSLAPGYAPLVTPAMVTGETKPGEKSRFGGQLNFLDATPDLSDVLYESEVPLLAGSAAGLYESEPNGLSQLVSVMPDGQPASSPVLGDEGTNVRGAVSADGSRVFFWAEGQEGAASGLYMRDIATGETVQLNAAQGVVEPTGEEAEVDFQAATPDGNRVFFTDTAPLTAQSTQHQELETDRYREADLYECEITENAGRPSCELTDLTPLPSGGSADVMNVILGASESGASIYFVANGVLAPGATQGHCIHQSQETPAAGATCNLYLSHEGAVTFIAALSNQDSGDWGSLNGSGRVGDFIANRPDLADVASRVSPNGQFLAFMSSMPLTGYANTDAKHPGVRDQEVYLYDASTGGLTCASCNSNGPSVGALDTETSGEGIGLLVDRRGDWSGQYLAGSVPGWTPLGIDGATHQPRYLSDSGRLFFNSPDELVPQATNAKEDVYEYEPDSVGSCSKAEGCTSLISSGTAQQESAFLEASDNGDSAFFLTAQPLVAADHDTDYDLYDARVCTSQSPCLAHEESSQRPCETSNTCKPASSPSAGTGGAPASAVYTGPGNTLRTEVLRAATHTKPLTRAQQLAKALKTCRKRHKNKKKRLACERKARKRDAPKDTAKKTASKERK
jgi:DNA-binding beta-propeller fold protein YncE